MQAPETAAIAVTTGRGRTQSKVCLVHTESKKLRVLELSLTLSPHRGDCPVKENSKAMTKRNNTRRAGRSWVLRTEVASLNVLVYAPRGEYYTVAYCRQRRWAFRRSVSVQVYDLKASCPFVCAAAPPSSGGFSHFLGACLFFPHDAGSSTRRVHAECECVVSEHIRLSRFLYVDS